MRGDWACRPLVRRLTCLSPSRATGRLPRSATTPPYARPCASRPSEACHPLACTPRPDIALLGQSVDHLTKTHSSHPKNKKKKNGAKEEEEGGEPISQPTNPPLRRLLSPSTTIQIHQNDLLSDPRVSPDADTTFPTFSELPHAVVFLALSAFQKPMQQAPCLAAPSTSASAPLRSSFFSSSGDPSNLWRTPPNHRPTPRPTSSHSRNHHRTSPSKFPHRRDSANTSIAAATKPPSNSGEPCWEAHPCPRSGTKSLHFLPRISL